MKLTKIEFGDLKLEGEGLEELLAVRGEGDERELCAGLTDILYALADYAPRVAPAVAPRVVPASTVAEETALEEQYKAANNGKRFVYRADGKDAAHGSRLEALRAACGVSETTAEESAPPDDGASVL